MIDVNNWGGITNSALLRVHGSFHMGNDQG